MADDTEAGAVKVEFRVFADSRGAHLVARPDGTDLILWPTWCLDSEGTNGPQPLGNWLRFVPSDYSEISGPYPAAVRELIASLS